MLIDSYGREESIERESTNVIGRKYGTGIVHLSYREDIHVMNVLFPC